MSHATNTMNSTAAFMRINASNSQKLTLGEPTLDKPS